LQRVLTDRGTEYCGAPERHEYELYLAVENIDHTRTKVKSPQTNGIVERFHKTVLNEFYRVAFRKKIYASIAQLQADLDGWLREYNELRPHQGRWCYGKTPLQTFLDGLPLAREKLLPHEPAAIEERPACKPARCARTLDGVTARRLSDALLKSDTERPYPTVRPSTKFYKLDTIRQELDHAHQRRHAPAIKQPSRKSLSGFSSSQRT
jgi:hypothetical protein